jgi:hypothetical protein
MYTLKIKIRKRRDTGGCTTTNGSVPTVPEHEMQVTLIMSSNHQTVTNLITRVGNLGSLHTQEEENVGYGLRKTWVFTVSHTVQIFWLTCEAVNCTLQQQKYHRSHNSRNLIYLTSCVTSFTLVRGDSLKASGRKSSIVSLHKYVWNGTWSRGSSTGNLKNALQ